MVNYDDNEDEGDNERSTLLNPEQGNVDSYKKLVLIWLACPRRKTEFWAIKGGVEKVRPDDHLTLIQSK